MQPFNPSKADLLAAYAQHVRARHVQPEWVKRHQFYLEIFLDYLESHGGFQRLCSFNAADVADFTITYARTHGIDSRRHLHTTLRGFLRFAHQQRWLAQDLTAAVPSIKTYRLSRAPRPISESAIEALLAAIDCASEAGCRDFAIIQLLRIYGIRAVQLRRLTLADIHWHADTIRFPVAKGGQPISVPLLPEAGNALADYLRRFRHSHRGCQELFLTATAPPRPLAAATISGCIHRRIKTAGIRLDPGVTSGAHAFRYACATRMLKANCSLKVIADALGHRHFDSVQIYNKLDTDALRSLALPWPEDHP
jgi:site-specific recombinase XerD